MENIIENLFSKGKKTPEPQKPLKFHEHPKEKIIVTARSFEEVMTDLRLPDSYFTPNQKVLSVGEGLSSFASTLKEKGVSCVAVDQIYALGSRLLDSQTMAEAEDELNLSSQKPIHVAQMDIDNRQGDLVIRERRPDIDQMVAADAAALPFPNECFDVVVAEYLTLYVDLEKTIPELIRVLKPGGEIRLGGVGLGLLINQKIIDDKFNVEGRNVSPALKMDEAFQWLGQQDNIFVWAILDGIPDNRKYSTNINAILLDKFGEPSYIAGTLIIKKNSPVQPVVGRMDNIENLKGKYCYKNHIFGGLYPTDYPLLGQTVALNMGVKETTIEKGFLQKSKKITHIKKEGFFVESLMNICYKHMSEIREKLSQTGKI